jgi:hypothetical protein
VFSSECGNSLEEGWTFVKYDDEGGGVYVALTKSLEIYCLGALLDVISFARTLN